MLDYIFNVGNILSNEFKGYSYSIVKVLAARQVFHDVTPVI